MAGARPGDEQLRVVEIYASIQGEGTMAGRPCVMVRLAGCELRCAWCDSVFAFTGGRRLGVAELAAEVAALRIALVELTGGEPLLQPAAIPLMRLLLERGNTVLLETSGSRSIAAVPPEVRVIMDIKAPGSGEVRANMWSNLQFLRPHHELKIVLASRSDYEWARDLLEREALDRRCPVLFSAAWGSLEPRELAEWIVEDRLPVRFQLQVHKVLWGPDARGV